MSKMFSQYEKIGSMNPKTERIEASFVSDKGYKHKGKLTRVAVEGVYYFGLLGTISILLNREQVGPSANVDNLFSLLRRYMLKYDITPTKEMIINGKEHFFKGLGQSQYFVQEHVLKEIINKCFGVTNTAFETEFMKPSLEVSKIINNAISFNTGKGNQDPKDKCSKVHNALKTDNATDNQTSPSTLSTYDTRQQLAIPITLYNKLNSELKSAERIANQLILLCSINGIDTTAMNRPPVLMY